MAAITAAEGVGRWERERELPAERVVPAFTVEQWAYVACVVGALLTRLAFLGDKPLHHDESLHATYTLYLFTGKGYHYDPLMHGPFQFLVTTALFGLFGASDLTTRLLPALLGTTIVFLPYLLRRELGRIGALFAAIVLALSPSFLYFSRFYRNDIYVACFTLGMVVCYWRFLAEPRPRWLIGGFALVALSFTAKENTYITVFIFGLWVLLTLLAEVRAVRHHRRAAAEAGKNEEWPDFAAEGPATPLLRAASTVGLDRCLLGFTAFAVIYVFFFTTAFTWWPGLHDGLVKGPQYWLAQHSVHRGSQPWWYYLSLLPLYEPLEVVAALAGMVVVARRPTGFRVFLVWWALLSLLIYSWAGEKMPWLILHPLLPLVLLAAVAVQALAAHRGRGTSAGWAAVGIGVLYMVHAAVPLAYLHPADPAELLVYTQTSTDVQLALRQIDAVALRTGQGRQLRLQVDGEDWWPFGWYLRGYPNITVGLPGDVATTPPVVIASDLHSGAAEAALGDRYLEEHLKLREWWLPDWSSQSARTWWDWLLYRRIWNPRGSTDFYLFIRRDLTAGL